MGRFNWFYSTVDAAAAGDDQSTKARPPCSVSVAGLGDDVDHFAEVMRKELVGRYRTDETLTVVFDIHKGSILSEHCALA